MSDVVKNETGFDWETAKRRMADFQRAISQSDELSDEQIRQLLDERAEQLARVTQQKGDTGNCLEVINFVMGGEQFAIETRFVREVYEADDITPLPGGAEHLIGLTNLRGDVLAIMDLRPFFDIANREVREHPVVLVLGEHRNELGIVAEAVREVDMLNKNEILEPPGSATGTCRDFLLGVTQQAMLVIDGGALLADERLFIGEKDG